MLLLIRFSNTSISKSLKSLCSCSMTNTIDIAMFISLPLLVSMLNDLSDGEKLYTIVQIQ